MASQGPLYPSTVADGGDGETLGPWQNMSNIGAVDGADATYPTIAADGEYSSSLLATNFGFSIPAGATITGVQVIAYNVYTTTGGSGGVVKRIQLIKGGLAQGDENSAGWAIISAPGNSPSPGSDGNMWGLTLTPSDVNASNFGAAFQFRAGTEDMGCGINAIGIIVYYTPGPFSFSGGITPAGAVVRSNRVLKDGAATPAGALLRSPKRLYSGEAAPAGVLAPVKPGKTFLAGITPTGATVRSLTHVFSGAATPAGALVRNIRLFKTAGATPSGAVVREPSKTLTAGLTPTGALALPLAGKVLAGAITPTSALVSKAARLLAGGITPTGSLGQAFTQALAGTVAPAGTLLKKAGTFAAGSLTPTGALVRGAKSLLSGPLTPSGALGRSFAQSSTGGITAAGVLGHKVQQLVAGAVATLAGAYGPSKAGKLLAADLAPTGSFVGKFALSSLAFVGSVTPAGVVGQRLSRAWEGAVTPAGEALKKAGLAFAGSVASAGDQAPRFFLKVLAGGITPSAELYRVVARALAGALTPTGEVGKHFPSMNLAGALTPAGAAVKKVAHSLAGAITPTGVGYPRILAPVVTTVLLAPQAVVQLVWSTVNVVLTWVKPGQAVETPDTDAEGRVI